MQVQLSQRKLEFYFSLTFKEDQVHLKQILKGRKSLKACLKIIFLTKLISAT